MTVSLSNSFVARLANSQLIPEEQLTRCIETVGEDEEQLAKCLLERNLLTRFQLRQMRAGSQSLTVGNYIMVDFLGRGGSGIVLKAYHKLMPDRFVAIKTIDKRSLHSSEETLARFRREIQIASRLDHINIVRALDVIQTRSHMYLVMEFVDGTDLGQMVQQHGTLSVPKAVDFAVQALKALVYAHEQGIVHRDLKPTNLLVTKEDKIKISDMGLARFFEKNNSSELTMKGLAIGTPEYMAPEQAEDARTADPRSDLYSLGATLFYMLTGTPTVQGSSYFFKLQNLLTAPVLSLAGMRDDVPKDLVTVVDQLRSRSPADRPQSAKEALNLLSPFAPTKETYPDIQLDPLEVGDVILDVLRGVVDKEEVCRRYAWTEADFREKQSAFLEGGRKALNPSATQSDSESEHIIQRLHAKIGAQQMEIEELKRQLQKS